MLKTHHKLRIPVALRDGKKYYRLNNNVKRTTNNYIKLHYSTIKRTPAGTRTHFTFMHKDVNGTFQTNNVDLSTREMPFHNTSSQHKKLHN